MHTVFGLVCFVVDIHWLIFPYPPGLLHWHCVNLTIVPVPAKQPWWIWINTSCEFIMNDCITTTKQSTTKPCAYFLGYTVHASLWMYRIGGPLFVFCLLLNLINILSQWRGLSIDPYMYILDIVPYKIVTLSQRAPWPHRMMRYNGRGTGFGTVYQRNWMRKLCANVWMISFKPASIQEW